MLACAIFNMQGVLAITEMVSRYLPVAIAICNNTGNLAATIHDINRFTRGCAATKLSASDLKVLIGMVIQIIDFATTATTNTINYADGLMPGTVFKYCNTTRPCITMTTRPTRACIHRVRYAVVLPPVMAINSVITTCTTMARGGCR